MKNRLSALLVTTAALGLGVGLSACGKKTAAPDAKFAPNPDGSPTAAAGATASAPTGQQIGVSDRDPDASSRPKMTDSARASYDRGMAAWATGDLQGAAAAFKEATDRDANAYQAWYSLGVMQERLGNAAALESYRKAFTLQDTYETAIEAYGLLLAKRGSLQEADDFLTGKHAAMPKSAGVLAALAEVKSLKKDTGAAQQLAQDALKLNPNFPPAMVVLARDHYRNRRLDLSLYAISAILDGSGRTEEERQANPPRDKNNAEARLLRATIYKEQGRRGPAIDELRTVVTARPDLVEASIQLAAYLLEAGNAEEAAPLLERAVKYSAESVTARLNLGDAYRILGKIPEAKKELDWVVAKDPNMPQPHYSLGLLYLFGKGFPGMDEQGQIKAAIAELEKYQTLRGTPTKGQTDDADQLILRAKVKLEALEAAKKAASAPPPPAASGAAAPPADSGAPPPNN